MHYILTFKPLELLWQHILDVVDKVTHCFAGNLTDYPAGQEL